jgi:hypothetical protein
MFERYLDSKRGGYRWGDTSRRASVTKVVAMVVSRSDHRELPDNTVLLPIRIGCTAPGILANKRDCPVDVTALIGGEQLG